MPDSGFYKHGPWIVPLAVTILIAGFNLFALIEKVDSLYELQQRIVRVEQVRITNLEYRIKTVENYCCSDKIKPEISSIYAE